MTNHALQSPTSPTSRRSFLADFGLGFTGLALGAMLAQDGVVRANEPEAGSRRMGSRTSLRKPRASCGSL